MMGGWPTATSCAASDARDRIKRAAALLRGGDVRVTDACVQVGCTSLGSFSASFTKLMGETPSACRAREHEALDGMPGCSARHGRRHRCRVRDIALRDPAGNLVRIEQG